MITKLKRFIEKLFIKNEEVNQYVYFINSSEFLPPPLSKEEEEYYFKEYKNGN